MMANCRLRPYCRLIVLAICGIFAYFVSATIPESWEPVQAILRGLGTLLLGAAVVDGLLTIRFQINIEGQVANLESSIQRQVGVLDGSIKTLQNTVAIASGAVESGLTAVYSERKECLEEINRKLTQIISDAKKAKEASPDVKVKMLGISLGDFLCPHGLLQPTFRDLLKLPKCALEIIVLKDGSKSALRRALREEAGKFDQDSRETFGADPSTIPPQLSQSYTNTKCHDELKTATNYLHDLVRRKIIDRDRPNKDEVVKAELKVYEYDYDPMAFLFMVDDDMYVENYHLAGRGGEAPILRVARLKRQSTSEPSRLYEIYSGHFEAMKAIGKEILIEENAVGLVNQDGLPLSSA